MSHDTIRNLALAVESTADAGSILHFDKSLLIQMAIQWFNILLLTAVLVRILYKPVKRYMAARSQRIRDELDYARTQREEAEALKTKYQDMLVDIEKEREELLHQAHRKAMERSDQLLLEARHEAEAILHKGLAELETERKNVSDEMKRQMIELSFLMAGRFVEVSIDRETQDRFIEEALSDWEENPW